MSIEAEQPLEPLERAWRSSIRQAEDQNINNQKERHGANRILPERVESARAPATVPENENDEGDELARPTAAVAAIAEGYIVDMVQALVAMDSKRVKMHKTNGTI